MPHKKVVKYFFSSPSRQLHESFTPFFMMHSDDDEDDQIS